MARAIWSGAISFGLVMVPVKVYSAVSRKDVRFNQLHGADGGRVQQKRVCSVDGEEVPYEEIVKGYEIEPGRYVTITPAELEGLAAERTRRIEIEEFVALDDIDPIHWESTYYLAPDRAAAKPYALLLAALESTSRVGLGRVVLRSKEYLAAIRPAEGALMLSTMLFADEIVPRAAVEELAGEPAEISPRELAIASQLVESLSAEWDPERFKDTYRERVLVARTGQGRGPRDRRACGAGAGRARRRPHGRARGEPRRGDQAGHGQEDRTREEAAPRGSPQVVLTPRGSAHREADSRHRAGPDAAGARTARARRARPRAADRLGARLGGRSRRRPRRRLSRASCRSAGRCTPGTRSGLPFLGRQRALLREAVDEGVPVLGICLGGQVLARALGAGVRPSERPEMGWLEVEPTPEAAGDPLLGHLRAPVGVYQWHVDVFDLPDGAVRLARSERGENQAFRYGERAWGLQFHPEVDAPLLAGWLQNYADAPARVGLDRDALEAAVAAGSPRFTEPLFGAFCSVCVAAAS